MKIRKQDLKELIKECLIELLSQGLGGQLIESTQRTREVNVIKSRPDNSQSTVTSSRPSRALDAAINEAAGSDNIMKDIFADTARTTLPSMLNERAGSHQPTGGSVEDQIIQKHEPAEIFGSEVVDRWASLAFNSIPKR